MATGCAAAAHGGYTSVALMPNTAPALDEPGVLERVRSAARASGSPVEVLAYGAVSAGRAGEQLSAMGELADAGVLGYSDDGAPVRTSKLLRSALLYAGMLGLPIVDHAEDLELTAGAEAHEGYVASVLGLAGWPVAAEVQAVCARPRRPRGRPRRRAAGPPPPDPPIDGRGPRTRSTGQSRRPARDVRRHAPSSRHSPTSGSPERGAGPGRRSTPRAGRATRGPMAPSSVWPFDTSLRVNPPLRTAADAAACLAALLDGTADAVVTDHAPHTVVDKEVEFGKAANGISGIETALGVLLALVDAGKLPLRRAVAALTTGPAGVAAGWPGVAGSPAARPRGLVEGAPADLVVFDRSDRMASDDDSPALQRQELASARSRAARSRAADHRRRPSRLRGFAGRRGVTRPTLTRPRAGTARPTGDLVRE